MSGAWQFVRNLDYIEEAIYRAPVMAARMSRAGHNSLDLLHAFNLGIEGIGHQFFVPIEAGHIRRRAKRNRERNRSARRARRLNRRAA